MGNNYTSLSTQDPNDIIAGRDRSRTKHSNSSSSSVCSLPQIRPSIHSDSVTALSVVRPGMVITGSRDKNIALNNVDTGECALKWTGHESEVTKLAYRNAVGNHMILSGSRDQTVKLWQFNSKDTQRTFRGHKLSVTGLVTIDDNLFVSGSRDTVIRLWDINSEKKEIRSTLVNRNLVTHITYHAASNLLAQSSEDKEVKLWDPRTLQIVAQLPRKNHIQMHCEFMADGNYVISSSNGFNGDGCEVSIWDVRTKKLLRELRGHEGSVTCVIFLNQQISWKKLLLSVSTDRTVRIWNAEDGNCLWVEDIPYDMDLLQCVAFNDAHIVVSGGRGLLAHLKLQGRAGKPFLQLLSMQKPKNSNN